MTAANKKPTQAEDLAEIGRSAYASILEMVERLREERDADWTQPRRDDGYESAEQAIQEDALSVQVRSGWCDPGSDLRSPAEYELLLATGGPAVRIVGELDGDEPTSARLEVQTWFTPWTQYLGVTITRGKRKFERDDVPDRDVLLDYAGCFYFGGE